MRPVRLALLIFSPFMPVLFLSSRLPGVPNNPYGVIGTLNIDRDDARVNYRRKKLEQLSIWQIQNARFKPASLLIYDRRAESAYGDQNAKPNRLAFLRLHFPNVTFSSARSMLSSETRDPRLYSYMRDPEGLRFLTIISQM